MQKLLLGVDRFNTWVGHAFAWTIVVLTLIITWEVFSRYALNTPHAWVFDATYMLYGTLFMMAGAYTLATAGHVRGDVLYGFFEPRTQAILDLILYFVFFIPGVLALCWAGWDFFNDSLAIREHSSVTSDGPPIYPFKFIIPLSGAALMLQGVVEILRCIVCIQHGEWPSRTQDVEEVDVDKLRHMVHADQPEGATAGSTQK
ncbi:TRAP transporter small permease subunit [Methyloversatilis universalis]|uniref:TRAP transporter small permease subunit n=1 Tax=Methyloversatilis universalis TaxID=378211 RepID=UPI000373FD68|nr:TRAP transporter small permease subunit [Methyloversatilis universalis]